MDNRCVSVSNACRGVSMRDLAVFARDIPACHRLRSHVQTQLFDVHEARASLLCMSTPTARPAQPLL